MGKRMEAASKYVTLCAGGDGAPMVTNLQSFDGADGFPGMTVLAGVASFGDLCQSNSSHPGVFTNVVNSEEWLRETIEIQASLIFESPMSVVEKFRGHFSAIWNPSERNLTGNLITGLICIRLFHML